MSDQPLNLMKEHKKERVVLDIETANIRSVSGCNIQTIPKRWIKRQDLKPFFSCEMEILLISENGRPHIEIRRVEDLE